MKTILIYILNALFLLGICFTSVSQTTVFEETLSSKPTDWDDNTVTFMGGVARLTSTNSWLASPTYDLSGYTDLTLTYDYGRFLNGGATLLDVQISTDGTNWTAATITSSPQAAASSTSWTSVTVNLSSHITPTATTRIRWASTYGAVRLTNVKLTGIAPSGGTASITLNNSLLSGFTYLEGNGPSTEQNFTVSGTDLTDDIIITAPTNYEISETSGSGFTSPITLTQSGGTVSATTIYVRLKASLVAGDYNNEDITVSSTGATSKTVTCNGSVTTITPTITLNTSSLSGFTYAEGSGPSTEQNFTVSGTDLTDDIIVTAPTNYEMSETSGSGFTSPITLTQSGGTVNATTIYVRLKAGLVAGDYNNEDITASSTGATSKTVTCNGTVSVPIYPEPDNHITNLNATPNSHNQITLTWDDAIGGQLPSAYLVKAAIAPAMPNAPVDGTVEPDGLLIKNIVQGTGLAIFSGLDASTMYNFAIWPYTNSGADINYKTDGSVPSTNATTLSAPVVIFSESIGSTFTTADISAHTDWDNGAPVVFSGDAAVDNTTASTGYTGASGSNNIFINNVIGQYFLIEGIDVRGYDNITLTLGHHKNSSTANNELKIEVSSDGTVWTELSYSRPTGGGTIAWLLITPNGTIPSDVENLRIRFTQTSSSSIHRFRVDDITLSGTALPPSNNLTVTSQTVIDVSETYDNVSIAPAGQLTLEDGVTLTVNGNFLIESDASGTGSFIQEGSSTLTVNGTSTVQKYLPNTTTTGWYISSPVSNAPYSTFSAADGLFVFDSPNHNWVSLDETDNNSFLNPTTGYVTRNTGGNFTLEFTGGNLNTGIITASNLERTGYNAGNFGWNLIGNPYPSTIDWDNGITLNQVNNEIHIRKGDGSVTTYVGGTGINGASPFIAPMQAFWVQVFGDANTTTNTGSVEFTNDSRADDASTFHKGMISDLLSLTISRDSYSDETAIRFRANATELFDPAFDANKLFSLNDAHPQIYSVLTNNKELAINCLPPLTANTTVNLGFLTEHAGTHTISAYGLGSFDSNVSIHLEDLFTNTLIDLSQQNTYTFSATSGTDNSRFVLHFGLTVTNTEELAIGNNIDIYASENNIYIGNAGENTLVSVFNMLGQKVLAEQLPNNTLNKINTNLTTGHYVVRVTNTLGTTSERIFIK